MNIAELILKLQAYPPDHTVATYDIGEGGPVPIEQITEYGDSVVLEPADKPEPAVTNC